MALSISTALREGARVIVADGEIDLSTSSSLSDAITSVVDSAGRLPVVVDLARVGFCDSSGIRVLVRGLRLSGERGLPYRVVGATGVVLDVLEVTGVWAQLSTPPATGP